MSLPASELFTEAAQRPGTGRLRAVQPAGWLLAQGGAGTGLCTGVYSHALPTLAMARLPCGYPIPNTHNLLGRGLIPQPAVAGY